MTKDEIADMEKDSDGLKTYEFIVNHLEEISNEQLDELIDHLANIDHSGQYLASGVRYMNGVDKARFSPQIERMTSWIIDRDREHKYLGDLILALYGADYYDRVEELAKDNNFRRMYKRLFPNSPL